MLTFLVVLGVVAVLFVAAVVATQDTDVLAEAPPDDADVELPPGRVVAEDLRSVRFGMVFRGYRMSEVDQVLDRLAGELRERDERAAELERALGKVLEPVVAEAEAQQATGDVTEAPPAGPDVPLPEREVPRRELPPTSAAAVLEGLAASGDEAPEQPPGHHRAFDLATSFALGTPAAEVVLPEAHESSDEPEAPERPEEPAVPAAAEEAPAAVAEEPVAAWWSSAVAPSQPPGASPSDAPALAPEPAPATNDLRPDVGETGAEATTWRRSPEEEREAAGQWPAEPQAAPAPEPTPAAVGDPLLAAAEAAAQAEPAAEAAAQAEPAAEAEEAPGADDLRPVVPETGLEPTAGPRSSGEMTFEPAPAPTPPAAGDPLLPPSPPLEPEPQGSAEDEPGASGSEERAMPVWDLGAGVLEAQPEPVEPEPVEAESAEPVAPEPFPSQPSAPAPGTGFDEDDFGFPEVRRADDDER